MPKAGLPRRALLGGSLLAAAGCAVPVGPRLPTPILGADDPVFPMPDGTRLPYRAWVPPGPPHTVVLALHGFNDSRDAWEIPAPSFAMTGIAFYAPDQRGFGATPERGLWPGGDVLADDAGHMVRLLRAQYPHARLVLMGESMGGAVLMRLATSGAAPEGVSGYVLLAPAVWGRARMNVVLRSGLWLASNIAPGMSVTGGGPVRVVASDNRDALIRLGRDPLTLRATRFDTLRGLVDLMDSALAAGPFFRAPSLFLYGGQDELVPPAATAATWRSLPGVTPPGAGPRTAFYPDGYHLLFRDLGREKPIADTIAWMRAPGAALPSGADRAAADWLAAQA